MAEAVEIFTKDGFEPYDHEAFKVGSRVYNVSTQYMSARDTGTATVLWVGRKKGSWEKTYGRKNIEILVRRDKTNKLSWWSDYGTRLAREQS